ncbi:hypothetical protein ACIBCR_14700 [Micromonospora echinospora]|uniref:hypothetical protein n=1 Tax=Micromonospora echinospora TaxID=1877 RepID=UPI0037ACB081
MDDGARRAAVAALRDLARSRDYRDRADAGCALASFAELPEAAEALRELVLDAGDTFVTRTTAEALLRRMDTLGLAVVGSALAVADPGHGDWIHTAVVDVFGVFSRDRDAAMRDCAALTEDPDEHVRQGADQLLAILADIDPVLREARNE